MTPQAFIRSAIHITWLALAPVAVSAQRDTTLKQENCKVTMYNGDIITVDRFWRIGGKTIEYEFKGNLHDLYIVNVMRIQCGTNVYIVENGRLVPVAAPSPAATGGRFALPHTYTAPPPKSPAPPVRSGTPAPKGPAKPGAIDTTTFKERASRSGTASTRTGPAPGKERLMDSAMYAMGMRDATHYFDWTGAGVLGFMLTPTLIGPPLVASMPARAPGPENPNRQLYLTHPDYKRGYDAKAGKRKSTAVGLGFLIGIVAIVALAASE